MFTIRLVGPKGSRLVKIRCTLEYAHWLVNHTDIFCGTYDGGSFIVHL